MRSKVYIRALITLFCLFILMIAYTSFIAQSVNTIIVDPSGSGNYTTIQAAINAASPGDTILVYSGLYKENVVVDRPISLMGMNTGSGLPVVDGSGGDSAINITADGVNLQGFNVTHANKGISVSSNHSTIKDNIASGMSISCGIYLDYSSYNDLTDNIVTNVAEDNIQLYYSDYNNLTGNNATYSDDGYGVGLQYSNNNILANNTVNESGLGIDYSNDNYLVNNTVDKSWDGIYIGYSNGNQLTGNSICQNSYYGVYLRYSDNNDFWLNHFQSNQYDVELDGGINRWNSTTPLSYTYYGFSYWNYTGNYWGNYDCSDNNVDGIGDIPYPIYDDNLDLYNNFDYYPMISTPPQAPGPVKNDRTGRMYQRIGDAINDPKTKNSDTIFVNSGVYVENVIVNKTLTLMGNDTGAGLPVVDGSGGSSAIRITANDVTIQGFNVTNAYDGIYSAANSSNLTGNIACNNTDCGIYLYGVNYGDFSWFNNVTGNIANHNGYVGIYFRGGSLNNVTGNIANNNSGDGIYFYTGSMNNVTANTFNYNDGTGIRVGSGGYDDTVSGNTANNNTAEGIDVVGPNHIVSWNTVNNNHDNGIALEDCTNTNVTGNTANNNMQCGIYLFQSTNNNITANTARNNNQGIALDWAPNNNNVVWLNTLMNNTINASDDGSGVNYWNSTIKLPYTYNGQSFNNYTGNYWGDYTGTDVNGDGIGDSHYRIGSGTSDNYPMILTSPVAPDPVKNLRNSKTFTTIQAAIDDANTIAGDTITVNSGTYNESVVIGKTLNLTGVDTGSGLPVVDGYGGNSVISITQDGVTLQGFNATNATSGIIVSSSNNVVKDNLVSRTSLYGIRLASVANNVVTGNVVSDVTSGIGIISSNYNNVTDNMAINDSGTGILLFASSNNNLTGNNASSDGQVGIYLRDGSNYNNLSGNTASQSGVEAGYGICLDNSNYNAVFGNTEDSNYMFGIEVYESNHDNVTDNLASGNYENIRLDSSTYNDVSENSVSGSGIMGCGIHLSASSYNHVSGNTADYLALGIEVSGGSYNSVIGNTASHNYNITGVGIDLSSTSGNSVINNTVCYQQTGVSLYNADRNIIWSNLINNNTQNAEVDGGSLNYWNSTVPQQYLYDGNLLTNYVGNYWGDYTGPDANHDGIGDTQYTLDTNNIDHYPMLTSSGIMPEVISTTPVDGATDVSASAPEITATFNEDVTSDSAEAGFTVRDAGSNPIAGTVSYNEDMYTATFTPSAPLADGMAYTVTINSVQDYSGNEMASPYSWSFTTSGIVDATPPVTTCTLIGTAGTNGWNTSAVTINLNATDAVSGVASVSYQLDSSTGTWTTTPGPNASLNVATNGAHTLYYTSVDNSGNHESIMSKAFKIDTVSPTVTSVSPPDGAMDISYYAPGISATFSEDLNASTLASGVTVVDESMNAVAGTVTYYAGNKTVTFTPSASLLGNMGYRISISGVKDTAGNPMAAPYSWAFITTTPPEGPVKNLRTGMTYYHIQYAITDANTKNGDTITVGSGMYQENVLVNKAVTLTGIDTGAGLPVVDGMMGSQFFNDYGFNITADGAIIHGFNVTNSTIGIFVRANYTSVVSNTVDRNGEGIYVFLSHNTVKGNTVRDNTASGIHLLQSYYDNVTANVVNNCSNFGGIFLDGASYNNLTGNTVNNNSFGIYLYDGAFNNNLTANIVDGNANDGIHLDEFTGNNDVTGNMANYNAYGVSLDSASNNNVTGNTIRHNTNTGIFIGNGAGNVLWLNKIDSNPVNASFIGTGTNYWNSTAKSQYTYNGHVYTNYTGNYWGDYKGIDVTGDGIGETPYTVNPNNVDRYPMVYSSVLLPAVISTSPANGTKGISNATTITAYFNENVSNVAGSRFTVKDSNGNVVPGSITYYDSKWVYTPSGLLADGMTYTANISGAQDAKGYVMAVPYVWAFTTFSPIIPAVISVSPPHGSVNFSIYGAPTVTFNEDIDNSTLLPGFTLVDSNNTPVTNGVYVNYKNRTAMFIPHATFKKNTTYTATISGVQDIAGNTLAAPYTWSFTTSALSNLRTSPSTTCKLTGVQALDGMYISDVTVNLTARSYGTGNGIQLTSYQLDGGAWMTYSGPFVISADGNHTLLYNSTDYAGNVEHDRTTTISIDTVHPKVIAITPPNFVNGTVTYINVTFDKDMDPASLTSAFTVKDWYLKVYTGTVSYNNRMASFKLTHPLTQAILYNVTISGATDTSGNLMTPFNWTIGIDKVRPVTTCTLTGSQALDGTYTTDVEVNLTATDGWGSGVAMTSYRLDGGAWTDYDYPFTVQGQGTHSLTYNSSDFVGNKESNKTIVFAINRFFSISSVYPTGGSTGISTLARLNATFNTSVDPYSVIVNLEDINGTRIPVTVSVTDNQVTLRPNAPLERGMSYNVTINACDLSGNWILSPYSWDFTTLCSYAIGTSPANGATGISATPDLYVYFDMPNASQDGYLISLFEGTIYGATPMLGSDIQYIDHGSGLNDGSVSMCKIIPWDVLKPNKTYTIAVEGIRHGPNNQLLYDLYESTFTTGPGISFVVSSHPYNGQVNYQLDPHIIGNILVYFDRPLNTSDLTAHFILKDDTGTIIPLSYPPKYYSGGSGQQDGSVSRVYLEPVNDIWKSNTTYTLSVTGVKGTDGSLMTDVYNITFATENFLKVVSYHAYLDQPFDESFVNVYFNDYLNSSDINGHFMLRDGSGSLIPITTYYANYGTGDNDGTVSFVELVPVNHFSNNTVYTLEATGVKNTWGGIMTDDYRATFANGICILSTAPSGGDNNVPITSAITATYNGQVDIPSIKSGFMLQDNQGNNVPGTVSYYGNSTTFTAVFTPSSALAYDAAYSAHLVGVKDTKGNTLIAYSWGFTTAYQPPTVTAKSPAAGSTGISPYATVTATFSKDIDASTLAAGFIVTDSHNNVVPGQVSYSGTTATFTPDDGLSAGGDMYTVKLTGIKGLNNNVMPDYTWKFYTLWRQPSVVSTYPANGASNVIPADGIKVSFNEDMEPALLKAGFIVQDSSLSPVPGYVTYYGANTTAIFVPTNALSSSRYTISLSGLKGLQNNLMPDYSFWFSTAYSMNGTVHGTLFGAPALVDVIGDFRNQPAEGASLDVAIAPASSAELIQANLFLGGLGEAINDTPLAMVTITKHGFSDSDMIVGSESIVMTIGKPRGFDPSKHYSVIRHADNGSFEELPVTLVSQTETTVTFQFSSPNGFCTFILAETVPLQSSNVCVSSLALPLLAVGVVGVSVVRKRRSK